jgi:hypothetical protein
MGATYAITFYEENGEGGFTSDLSTSVFDFFFSFFASFFASFFSFFTLPASLFALFDLVSFLAIASSPSRAAKSPITIDRRADNDCADECPDKYVHPSVFEQNASNDTEHSTN